ncbi:replication-relaxation family protein [Streptomyces odonnellii]|uniref:replication-relaxation family protein n=1 Tax=Streptomyces odonnellii TaxID=1417980 RepID=UPI0006260FA6|nr:replication-relaxation family protein [Streptomyces odonnellii]
MSQPIDRRAALPRLAQQLLPVLYQHRLLATSQLHQLLTPHTRRPVYLLRQLCLLRSLGLAEATVRRNGRMGRSELLWYITPLGSEIVERSGEVTARAYRISPQAAASQLQEHTLAIVDTGLAFAQWARELGDECGPLDWEPELAHRIRDGENRLGDDAFFIPDAVLRYTRTTEDGRRQLLTYFIEVDRATMQVARLGRKLSAYARYASYTAQASPGRHHNNASGNREAWRDRYPAFPRLLVVLTGAPAHALARRADDLRAVADTDPRLRRTGMLAAGITTLQQLCQEGPFAPIVTPVTGSGGPTDVLLASSKAEAAT